MRPIIQGEATECGLACLAMVASHYGLKTDLIQLRQSHAPSLKGANLRQLIAIADELNLSARAVKLELNSLANLKCPAILHWDMSHFVVLVEVRRNKIILNDPAQGRVHMSIAEASDHFTGVALELSPTVDFRPRSMVARTRLSDFWSRMSGLKRALIQIALLSIVFQGVILALPLYLQIAVDEAILRYDESFLLILALGFGFLYLISAITEALRSWVILLIGQSLTFQMAGNILRHLLRLPTSYFEKRHLGDVVSRMMSVQPIQEAMTQSVVAALIDGLLALTTAALIIYYDWRLALIVFGMTILYVIFSAIMFPMMRRRNEKKIIDKAVEQTFLMETIQGARAIKLFGGEADREAGWRNAYTRVVNATVAEERLSILLKLGNSIAFGLQIIIVVFAGSLFVINGEMSIGMLFAFMAYRQNFVDRILGLVEKGIEFRMLGLHVDRLTDIVQTPREEGLDRAAKANHERLSGAIELKTLSFRYSAQEPCVFEDVNVTIEPGEFVSLTGPSGGGKTTLLKVMLGLLTPASGQVIVDQQSLSALGLRHFRSRIGVVMQDDSLLSGTIAENIAFFDPELDEERVRKAARDARIAKEIDAMPMGYYSYIGDMGAALSGGQRQRLLLARALYRDPDMLFLDEGTANLDEAAEQEIGIVLKSMPMTKFVIAHRPELIRIADRILRMENGKIVDVTNEQVSKEKLKFYVANDPIS